MDRLDLYAGFLIGVALLVLLGYLAITNEFGDRTNLAGIAALDLMSMIALLFGSRGGVWVSTHGIMIRRFVSPRIIAWSEVAGFEVKPPGYEGPMSRVVLHKPDGRTLALPGFRFQMDRRDALSFLVEDLNGLLPMKFGSG